MASLGDYVENKLLDTLTRNGAAYQPAALYLAVFTVNPNFETGSGGTEATGGAYVRKTIAFDVASSGATTQTSLIEWTCGTDIAAATYTGWAVYDASTSGNFLFGDTFSASRTLASGDKLQFAAGAIDLSLT